MKSAFSWIWTCAPSEHKKRNREWSWRSRRVGGELRLDAPANHRLSGPSHLPPGRAFCQPLEPVLWAEPPNSKLRGQDSQRTKAARRPCRLDKEVRYVLSEVAASGTAQVWVHRDLNAGRLHRISTFTFLPEREGGQEKR